MDEIDAERDITVDYQCDSGGRLVTMIAYNAKGDDQDPNNENVEAQATKYLYTSLINASWQTGAVYPDSEDELEQDQATKVWTFTDDNGDHVSTEYDRLGRKTSATDQRGVEHTYVYDSAGRLSADEVTDFGDTQIVDETVKCIGTTYDDAGRVETVTSFSVASDMPGYELNQIKYEYNAWGKLYREYQEHDGEVDTGIGGTPYVQYNYEDGSGISGVAKYIRLAKVIYPSGREVDYGYGTAGAVDYIMSRLTAIFDDVNDDRNIDTGEDVYASYKYLGTGRIVVEDYGDIDVKLDYTGTSNDMSELDRFGRVANQIWKFYSGQPLDQYVYHYDRAGNRTSKSNGMNSSLDENYEYNYLDELTATARANGFDQSWTLDGLGNWSGFDNDGTPQTRTVNEANEIIDTDGLATPTYDLAGNMISDGTLNYKYDAWNRQTAVDLMNDDPVATYIYDGLNRRIRKNVLAGGPYLAQPEYYYNNDWQMLEERHVTFNGSTLKSNQYVWSARYIDSPVVRFHEVTNNPQYNNVLYYTTDANHNVTALVDASGEVVERYYYDPYGKAVICDADWVAVPDEGFGGNGIDGDASAYGNNILYCGYYYDSETARNASITLGAAGNYQVRNRYLSTQLGLFISRDPIGYDADDANLYRYCGNNPVNVTDPTGTYTPRPQTDEEKKACAAAHKNAPAGASGATVCFNSKPLVCNWGTEDFYRKKGFTSDAAIDIFSACVYNHEDSHVKDTQCAPKTPGLANPQCPAKYDPQSYSEWSECKALQASVDCISPSKCKGDATCEAQVKFYQDSFKNKMKDKGCADVIKNGPKLK